MATGLQMFRGTVRHARSRSKLGAPSTGSTRSSSLRAAVQVSYRRVRLPALRTQRVAPAGGMPGLEWPSSLKHAHVSYRRMRANLSTLRSWGADSVTAHSGPGGSLARVSSRSSASVSWTSTSVYTVIWAGGLCRAIRPLVNTHDRGGLERVALVFYVAPCSCHSVHAELSTRHSMVIPRARSRSGGFPHGLEAFVVFACRAARALRKFVKMYDRVHGDFECAAPVHHCLRKRRWSNRSATRMAVRTSMVW
ncbi:hypothetical protein FB451DRAFT_1564051 [Mycena latifolia]|nr:hypothetical protein FB451DRAFT_1564051 [Mycena latifolia]